MAPDNGTSCLAGLSFFLSMAYLDKLLYPFLFTCNGHLPYGSIPHPQMGEKSRQRVVKHVLRNNKLIRNKLHLYNKKQ